MKHLKRWMSVLLTAVMLLPMLVIPSVAEDATPTEGELYRNDFEIYAEREGEYLVKNDGFAATVPSKVHVGKDGDNTYLRFPMESANDPNKTVYYTCVDRVYKLVEEGTEGAYCTDEASYGLISGDDKHLNRNLQLNQPALDAQTTPVVVLQTEFYLSEDANGTIQSQFISYVSDGVEANWLNLFLVDLESGFMTIGGSANINAQLAKGEWSTVSIMIDLCTGEANYYLNYACVAVGVNLGGKNLTLPKNTWIIAKVPRTNNLSHVAKDELGGWFGVDNACIYTPEESPNVSVPEKNADGEVLLYTEVLKNGTVQYVNSRDTTYLKSDGYSFNPVYFDTSAYRGVIPSVTQQEIRLTDEGGIRFINSLDLEKYAALQELERAGEISELRFGTLIAPMLYVERAGALRVEELETLREQVSYVTVDGNYGAWYGEDTAEDGLGIFAGSLLGIKPSHYTDGFAAVGFISFKVANGKTQYLYGTYESAVSVEALAKDALQASDSYTDAERGYLNSFESTFFTINGSAVSEISLVSNYLFFRAGDAYACLTYTGNYGWRLKVQSADHLGFEGMGAAQALAMYMNEESPDDVRPIFVSVTDDGTLRVTTKDGTYAELVGAPFALNFYSPEGEKTLHLEKLRVNGDTVELQGRLTADEGVFGGGERFDDVNRRGTLMTLYAADRWNNSGATYMAIPLFTTSRGGGIYVNRYESMTADFSMRNTWLIKLKNDVMDCYLFSSGDMKDAITGYTRLTGEADTPEEWAYGVMICRYSKDFQTFEEDQIDATTGEPILNRDNAPSGRSVKTIVNALINAGMKPSSVVLEPWGHTNISLDTETALAKREELQATVEWLDALNIKTMLYIPVGGSFNVSTMKGFKEEYLVHAYVTVNGVTTYTTQIPTVAGDGSNPDASSSSLRRYLDVTNPEACAWYYDVIWGQLIDIGIDGVKIDFCEQLPDEDYDYKGTTVVYDWYDSSVIPQGGEHHSYPVYFISSFYKRMQELKEANGETDGFYVLSRGGGIGSQRNPFLWAGDQARNFEKLDDQLIAVVSSGMSGVPFMTYDMAGYRYGGGGTTYDDPDSFAYESEMFARAISFTAFMPNIQTHGTVRNVYEMTQETQQIYRNFLALREELTPYITTLTQYAAQTGIPVARHPVLHYQDDTNVYDIRTQFMLGDALMIAPILARGVDTRTVYLPEGSWTDLLTGKTVTGGQTITVTANLGQVPVFLNNDSADADMLREIFEGDAWQEIRDWK
ncbi:MAG: glycoside hydrolase family 31 protein [Clostridia bacterium]|nr:glycoside hydrolase family 31 protein [Clostridia bacterium]